MGHSNSQGKLKMIHKEKAALLEEHARDHVTSIHSFPQAKTQPYGKVRLPLVSHRL